MTLKFPQVSNLPAEEGQLPGQGVGHKPNEQQETAEEATSQGGEPTNGDGAEELQARLLEQHRQELEKERQKFESDMNRLRSSLDSRYSRDRNTWEEERQQLLSRMDQLVASNLDEGDRASYEYERMQSELERERRMIEEERQNLEAQRSMMQYAQVFQNMGVPQDQLNMNSPEELLQSGWMGVHNTVQQLRNELDELRNQRVEDPPPSNKPNSPVNKPNTFTGKGTVVTPKDPFVAATELLKARMGRDVTPEEVFQALDGGHIDINQLLG